jgi:hypothetical protein
MKKLNLALLLIVSALSACKKAGTNTADNGCISRIDTHSSTILLSATDQAIALNLFQQNHVTVGALQFYWYSVDNASYTPPGPYQYVSSHQYFSNLLLFNGDMSFTFRQGIFISTSGLQYTAINLDTNPHLTLADVRAAFLKISANAKLKDSCLNAQFGYYNIGNGSGTPPENFVKAWKVTLKTPVPAQAATYLRDDNGNSVYDISGQSQFN